MVIREVRNESLLFLYGYVGRGAGSKYYEPEET
jgi:hypothetical protein